MKLALCIAVILISWANGATISAKGGPWSSGNSWIGGKVPSNGDSVTIGTGAAIKLDTRTANIVVLSIEEGGSLAFDNGKGATDTELALTVETFFVAGILEMGTNALPLARPARVILTNYDTPVSRAVDGTVFSLLQEPYGKKVLLVHDRGVWTAHAVGRRPIWTKLTATAQKGDRTITVLDKVDWKVGDEIIITSTDFNPDQTERTFVDKVVGNTITLRTPLKWIHFGQILEYQGFPVDMRAEVSVLSSNLKIYGDMTNGKNYSSVEEPLYAGMDEFMQFGGHTAYVHNASVHLEGIEMWNMGQGGRLGRYPVHWHIMHDAGAGQYLKRSSLHDMFLRCVSIHSTNNITLEDVLCYDTYGHSVYQEDGDEFGNIMTRVLAVISRPIGTNDVMASGATTQRYPAACSTNPPGLRQQFQDFQPSGFWITNTNTTIEGCVAVGHEWGFWIHVEPVFNEPDYYHGCTTCPAGCRMTALPSPTHNFNKFVFRNNVAHSNLAAWWVKENWTPDNYTDMQLIEYFTVYKNRIGVQNYGISNMNFSNIVASDNTQSFTNDWVRGGRVVISNSIFIKESENFGNPDDPTLIKCDVNCSAVFPNNSRTWVGIAGESTLNVLGIQVGDEEFVLQNVWFVNYQANALEKKRTNYLSWAGPIIQPIKRGGLLPPYGRYYENVYFVNSPFLNSYNPAHGVYYYPSIPNAGYNQINYLSGLRDKTGSLPCSTPGSYWFWPNEAAVTDDCVYHNASDMYRCPPPPSNGIYDRINIGLERIWSSDQTPWLNVSATSDCGKSTQFTQNRQIILRTDKNYTVDLEGNVPKTNGITLRGSSWDFSGMWMTFRLPGTWSVQYRYFCSWPPNWDNTLRSGPNYIVSECHCGDTWTKIWIPATKNTTNGPNGCQAEWLFDPIPLENATCDSTCGNPWPPAQPAYTCGQKLVQESDANCAYPKAPTYRGLDWVKPLLKVPFTGTLEPTSASDDIIDMSSANVATVSVALMALLLVLV